MRRGNKFAFELDRSSGKLLGVCAGIAKATGWDVTLIRVALVVATVAFHWTALLYFVAAWFARPKAADRYEGFGSSAGKSSAFEARRSTAELDRRLAEVETYVASQNNSLAREIESLR